MATDKKQLGIRFSSDRCEYIKQLQTELGISKNAVVEMMVDFYRSHTQSVSTFDKASAGNALSLNKGVSTSKSVSTLKGSDAELVLLRGGSAWILGANNERKQVVFHDGYLWLVSKSANGSQRLLTKALACTEELFRVIATRESTMYSYANIEDAPKRLKQLQAMEYAQEYFNVKCGCDVDLVDASLASDDNFESGILHITIYAEKQELAKIAMAEATAVVEVVNDGVSY